MCANYPSTPRITTLARVALLLSLSLIKVGAGSTAHAAHPYVSDLSLDWAVVASHGIVEAEVAGLNDPKITYRVTAILKQTDAPLVEIGSVLEDTRHFSPERKLGDKTVLFFFAQETAVHAAINLSRPRSEDGLAIDRDGKPILTPEELLARIRRLVDDGRKENGGTKAGVSQEGVVAVFEVGVDPDYGEVLYRRVLVPPQSPAERAATLDPREVFSQSSPLDFAGQDVTWYWPKTPGAKILAKHEQRIREAVARTRQHKLKGRAPWKEITGGATMVALSPDADLMVAIGYGIVSLVDTATGDTVYRSTECTESLMGLNHLILSPGNKFFAHLCANGDVIVVDIAGKQVKSRGKLPWTLSRTIPPVWPAQFSFSPDARYLALNLDSYMAGWGTALIVWRTDSGECVFTKSPNWELKKEFYIRGFGPKSRHLRYEETAYWDLENGRPVSWVMTDWRMGNVWPDPVRDQNARQLEIMRNKEFGRPN